METAPEQLSFEQLAEQQDQSSQLAMIPYTDYHLINSKEFTFPKRRFFIFSIVIHIFLAAYALTVVIEKLKPTEVIEVSFESPSPAPATQASFSQPEAPAVQEPSMTPDEAVIPVKAPVVKSAAKSPAKIKTSPVATKSNSTPIAAALPTKSQSTSSDFKAEPLATISDIEVPALTNVDTEVPSNLSLNEIENDFDEIDKSQNEKIMAVAKADSQLLEESISDLDAVSQNVSSEESNLDDIAAERIEKLNAQKLALQKSAAAAASSAGPAITSTKPGKTNTRGNDSATLSKSTGVGSDSEGIVRRLEDLRQRPGNPRPDYDVNDRLNNLSGTIVINAYVTKDGNLTMFRLIQSTGHRNLDRKTLAALKRWKFFPGQEGWVELPFKWDLKGGVQQKPTLLKRR